MAALPILDLYVLSLLDRGLTSMYQLQKDGGLSLGASTPALNRLQAAKLVQRLGNESTGNRVRYHFRLTAAGRRTAREGWHHWTAQGRSTTDIDALLRLLDMALHYKRSVKEAAELANSAASLREGEAEALRARPVAVTPHARNTYPGMHAECEAERLIGEATALRRIARRLGEPANDGVQNRNAKRLKNRSRKRT